MIHVYFRDDLKLDQTVKLLLTVEAGTMDENFCSLSLEKRDVDRSRNGEWAVENSRGVETDF